MAKYLGKINLGWRGKGDVARPKTKHYNLDLFLTLKEMIKFKNQFKKIHCCICKKRAYQSTTFYNGNKILVVCRECKDKIYIQ